MNSTPQTSQIIAGVVGLTLLMGIGLWGQSKVNTIGANGANSTGAKTSGVKQNFRGTTVCLNQIDGAVVSPGIYSIPANSRVMDLVKIAGGFSKDANEAEVNLVKVLKDGDKVHIPQLKNIGNLTAKKEINNSVSEITRLEPEKRPTPPKTKPSSIAKPDPPVQPPKYEPPQFLPHSREEALEWQRRREKERERFRTWLRAFEAESTR
jgi:SLBB domain